MKKNSVLKFVNHSKRVISIAQKYGWYAGARYTNLRDTKTFNQLGFLDIDWKNYDYNYHLDIAKLIKPIITVAKDIECISEVDKIIYQATELSKYSKYVIIVPKAREIGRIMESIIPREFIFGYSVPTKYGGTQIETKYFRRPVHLLGGRPDVQRKLANEMKVFSLDCNRFTLDASFGDYFDGEIFRPHPIGGYVNCINDSIKNINHLWSDYTG